MNQMLGLMNLLRLPMYQVSSSLGHCVRVLVFLTMKITSRQSVSLLLDLLATVGLLGQLTKGDYMKNTIDLNLSLVAEKFGKVPTRLTQKAQIVPEYMSEEEFALLPQCPREGTVETLGKWPTIGGRRTYPLSGALNETEKARYNELKRESRAGVVTPRASTGLSTNQKEFNEKLDGLIEFLKAEGASDACIKATEALKIREPNKLLYRLLGTEDIPTSVSRYALMFRKADGSRLPYDISAADFAVEATFGLKTAYNNEQLTEALEQLKAQGIELNVV